jgi:predicted nucleic acid-binding Zn ribbon protein
LKTKYPRIDSRRRAVAEWRRWDWVPEETARTDNTRASSTLIVDICKSLGLETRRLSETSLLQTWQHQMDPNIVAHAQPTGLRNGTLFVTVDNSVWLHEIVRYHYPEILRRLHYSFGPNLIARISFRLG